MKLIGVGLLVDEVEVKEISYDDNKSTYVANFTLRYNEFRKKDDENIKQSHYFDFEIWDSAARYLASKASRGDMIAFEAIPRQNRWENADGEKKEKTVFRVLQFQILTKKNTYEENFVR